MSLNSTPSADRIHIGIFGRRNAGKSSIINAITGQDLAIVSNVKGTTTDPVLKAMELLPLGPIVLIDTPGLDDEGALGQLRIQKAKQMLNKTDIALLVIDNTLGLTNVDREILTLIQKKEIPYLLIRNKCDLKMESHDFPQMPRSPEETPDASRASDFMAVSEEHQIAVSAKTGFHIEELKERIAAIVPKESHSRRIIGDLVAPGSLVLLVVPIDSAAPKGRLILPQQQTIRDLLDAGVAAVVVRDTELSDTLWRLDYQISLVVTDSQIFPKVAAIVPPEIPLTSFSILFARYKGNLETVVRGAQALDDLQDGDTILISEGCTHHRQCEDIGTVKLPRWIQEHAKKSSETNSEKSPEVPKGTFRDCKQSPRSQASPDFGSSPIQKELRFEFTSGAEFPADLSPYRMIIHCGGCMLNEREMKYRLSCANDAGIPITNYGTAIAHMKGILKRSTEIFRHNESIGGETNIP